MTRNALYMIDAVRTVSLLVLVLTYLNRKAAWSRKAQLPAAIIAFVSSAAHLFISIS